MAALAAALETAVPALFVLSLPLLVLSLLAHSCLGISVTYLLRCIYLEIRLRAARSSAPDDAKVAKGCALSAEEKQSQLRGITVVSAAEYAAKGQSCPPSKRVSTLFPKDQPPAGRELPYEAQSPVLRPSGPLACGRRPRERRSEGPEEDEAWWHRTRCLREGAEVHRQVRQYVQQRVRPGMELREIVEMVENASSALVGFDARAPLQRSFAFPTGLSLNEVATHDSVNPGDAPRWLRPGDLAKLDFGVQVEGHILDCAFSFTFGSVHDELMQAVKEATYTGIKFAGPDALVAEMGGLIQEVMESAEVHRPDGKVLPIYSIKNLTGHTIEPYRIHAGKSLPSCNFGGSTRMLPGELWAIETFGSAGGVGFVCDCGPCSHFMRPSADAPSARQSALLSQSAKAMLELIDRRFSTLAFCPRWVLQEAARSKHSLLRGSGSARGGQQWWSAPLDELSNVGLVTRYPPLADLPGSFTAQYEHTVLLRGSGKEILTHGADY